MGLTHSRRGLTVWQLNALCLCVPCSRFTISNSEWPHMHFQRQLEVSLRLLMTGTQPHNVWTYFSIWMSYFQVEVCSDFLLYLTLTSNIYQNSYKGTTDTFIPQYWRLKKKNLNMISLFCYETVFNNFTVLK